jgi:hypothetical protein
LDVTPLAAASYGDSFRGLDSDVLRGPGREHPEDFNGFHQQQYLVAVSIVVVLKTVNSPWLR